MAEKLSSRLARWFSPQFLRVTVSVLLLATSFIGFLAYGSWTRVCAGNQCPSIAVLEDYRPQQTSKIYASDGRLITELGLERRTLIRLADMPPHLLQAFIAIEDKRFYQHHGIDFVRVVGAIRVNLLKLRWEQGFSTITMQLARNGTSASRPASSVFPSPRCWLRSRSAPALFTRGAIRRGPSAGATW
jgi:penicillin-binding protein 1A